MAPHLDADALVLSLQNGVENAATIARRVRQPVVPAVVYVATAMPEPGRRQALRPRRPRDRRDDAPAAPRRRRWPRACRALVDLFATAEVPVRISADVMAELWSKLMVNCAYNAISGLAQAPYGRTGGAAVDPRAAAGGRRRGRGGGRGRRRRPAAARTRSRRWKASPRRCRHSSRRPRRTWRAASRARSTTSTASSPGAAASSASPTPANQALHALVKLVEAARPPMAEPVGGLTADAAGPRGVRAGACASSGWPAPRRSLGRPLTGGVSSDIWRIDTARGPVCAKRALRQAARRRRLARADRAQPLRGALDAGGAARRAPGCTAAGARPASAPRRAGDELPRAGRRYRAVEAVAARRARRRRRPRAPSARCWRASTRYSAARPRARGASSTPTRSSSTSASSPTCWRRRRAIRTWRRRSSALVEDDAGDTRVALVHGDVSPKNILVGAARAGAARRRVRLVGRPGVRPRVLPQPPAAEVPVDAARRLRPSSPASMRSSRAYLRRRRLGAARGARAARGGAAAGPPAGARRRQVAGRVPHRRGRSRRGCAASRRALLRRSGRPSCIAIAAAWRAELDS